MCSSCTGFVPLVPLHRPARRKLLSRRRPPTASLSRILPSALCATAAAAMVAVSASPTAPPNVKRVMPAAAVTALASSALLRPKGKELRESHGWEELRGSVVPGQGERRTVVEQERVRQDAREGSAGRTLQDAREESTGGNLQDIFANSRLEWERDVDRNAPAAGGMEDEATGGTAAGVYSYSYGKSRKKQRTETTESATSQSTANRFQHMRAEFANDFLEADEDDWEHSPVASTASPVSYSEELSAPERLSTTKLVRSLMQLPMWTLSEIILPITDIVSLVWFDTKVQLLNTDDQRTGADRYFLPPLERKRIQRQDVLTEEEKQVRMVQEGVRKAARNVQRGVRDVEQGFRKLLDELS